MSLDQIRFSCRLSRELRIHRRWRPHLRVFAVVLTVGELLVFYFCCRRSDYLSAYAMGAYLAKEKVIAHFTREG